jgi:hypothetical protein
MKFFKMILFALLLVFSGINVRAQSFPNPLGGVKEPWSKKQLIEPSALAQATRSSAKEKPLIFNIGVVEDIKGAKNMGAASEKENLERFSKVLKGLPKTTSLVVYCGCCPFNKCPNIRPAFTLLKQNGFENARLLNLPTNIKVDWINKGYPLASKAKQN